METIRNNINLDYNPAQTQNKIYTIFSLFFLILQPFSWILSIVFFQYHSYSFGFWLQDVTEYLPLSPHGQIITVLVVPSEYKSSGHQASIDLQFL